MLRLMCLSILASLWSLSATAERKIALLIGNADYVEAVGELQNPLNDVEMVKAALMNAGFAEADIMTLTDASRIDMLQAVSSFANMARELTDQDTALFYYSGHGAKHPEAEGTNLIPIGINDVTTDVFWFDTISLESDIISRFENANDLPAWLIAVDACRNELRLPTRGLGGGDKSFGVVPQAGGMLIAFAADAGQTAKDGFTNSTTSPFATVMAQELVKPGRPVSTAFGAIRPEVMRLTGNAQQPVVTNKLNRDPILVAGAFMPRGDDDETDWQRLSASGELDDYRAYLRIHPSGKYAEEARKMVEKLEAASPSITGQWLGFYAYSGGRNPVNFSIQMNEMDGALTGIIKEPNTFGNATAANLYATLAGRVDGIDVYFRKTYDGSGGQTHSVEYTGTIMNSGRKIVGEWRIGASRGEFEVSRP